MITDVDVTCWRSFQSLDVLGHWRDDSSEILLLSFLLEAHVSISCTGRDVHFLMLFIQHFLN